MTSSPLEEYLSAVDARATGLVRVLDGAIRAAHPELDVAIKYRILMYTIARDWRTWVCAIDARSRGVSLRFLYGVLLDDPLGVLRAGSSVLKTWDFAFDDVIDAQAVRVYVTEAVAKHEDYKAKSSQVLDASRAAAKADRRR
jgi:hypothetical protein